MVEENIKKIKKAEEEGERIIKEAEKRVIELMNSIETEIKKIREMNDEKLKEEIEKYKLNKEVEKKEKIELLEKEKKEKLKKIKEKENITENIVEEIWNYIINNIKQK
jgi:hypothetical protein